MRASGGLYDRVDPQPDARPIFDDSGKGDLDNKIEGAPQKTVHVPWKIHQGSYIVGMGKAEGGGVHDF